jgi:hypothetical protein
MPNAARNSGDEKVGERALAGACEGGVMRDILAEQARPCPGAGE